MEKQMIDRIPTIPTIASLAAAAGCSHWRVQYLVRSKGIKPSGRAGNIGVFSREDALRILELATASATSPATNVDGK